MIKVGILLIEGFYLYSVNAPISVLQIANSHLTGKGRGSKKAFTWQFIGESRSSLTSSGCLDINPGLSIDDDAAFDLVFVPDIDITDISNLRAWFNARENVCQWLRKHWINGAYLVGTGAGVTLIARTGLLDGLPVAIFTDFHKMLKTFCPNVIAMVEEPVSEHNRVLCCGSVGSHLQPILRAVEHLTGADISRRSMQSIMEAFSINVGSPSLVMNPLMNNTDPVISRARHWLQLNLHKPVTIANLAAALAISDRTLLRHFKNAIGQTPMEYLKMLRLATAKQLLTSTDLPLKTIVSQVGYLDLSSFSRSFKKEFGISPIAIRSSAE